MKITNRLAVCACVLLIATSVYAAAQWGGFDSLRSSTGKTFTYNNTLAFSGTDGSTLNVGAGGTLGTAAYTASTDYAPSSSTSTATDWNKWDGGASGLNATTGRTSLGLGTSALSTISEGTWTGTLNGFTIVGGTPNMTCRYSQVASLVYVECTISGGTNGNTSFASVAGTSNISGLPFTPANASTCQAANGDGIGHGVGATLTMGALYTPAWAAYAGNVYVNAVYRK